jgi:hypothetical protein
MEAGEVRGAPVMSSIIDFHTHVFPDDLAPRAIADLKALSPLLRNTNDGTRRALVESMRRAGISRSVTLPVSTKPSQVGPINRESAAAGMPELVPFGTLHPRDAGFESQIAFLRAHNIPGVKFHSEYQDFHAADRGMFPVYEALQDAGLVVVFHAGLDPGPFANTHALPSSLRVVAQSFPRLRMVSAHMGGMLMWHEVEESLVGTNVYFDTSAVIHEMPTGQFLRIVRAHGSDKVLFGSDSPWFDQKECVEWVDALPLSSTEKERIFSGNACGLCA